MLNVAMIGAGSWGTALAVVLADNGHQVDMWSKECDHVAEILADGENKRFLPEVMLAENIKVSCDLPKTCQNKDIVVMAIPSHAMRAVAEDIKNLVGENTILVSVAKGFEEATRFRMSQVLQDVFPTNPVVVLSGPSHAEEVGKRMYTGIVSSSENEAAMICVQEAFSTEYMRVYANKDVIGVELGAALKNIIALASGICYGIGGGDNTEAAMLTRGLTEIVRLGTKMGADVNTFYGLAGMGDLVVTCGSKHSRNRRAGTMLGEGKSLDDVLAGMGMVVEGVNATKIAYKLAEENDVEMPITQSIYNILYNGADIKEVILGLMNRDKKTE